MAKKAKRTVTKKSAPQKEKHDFLTWSVAGKKIHPGASLLGGAAIVKLGGIAAIAGGVLAVASAVALAAHLLRKKK